MIADHLSQLRRALLESDSVPETTKAELLRLLAAAENEAANPAGEAMSQTSETATVSAEGEPTVLEQLKTSLEELENSHPEATGFVNRFATVLANMGI